MTASPTNTEISVIMMSEDSRLTPKNFLLWRCLHNGPFIKETIDHWGPDEQLPWATYQARNLPLLQKLTRVYGSCAVTAWDGERVVGMLRFYPKAICAAPAAGMLCLQQEFPYGPADHFTENNFPPMQELADKTLRVHCIMTGCPAWKENPYQRRGIGTRLVKQLIRWGKENGWAAIEATAYEEIPMLYEISGQAGKRFWEKLGFEVCETGIEAALLEENEFTSALKKQMIDTGLPVEIMKNKYTMRLPLYGSEATA